MRSENSVKNSLFAIVGQAVSLLFGFVTRIQFVRILGEAYLGVNGVFYSVLSLLSLTELGLGSAITYALYRPLADKDDEATGRIMNLFARAYRIVAAAVTLLGLCLMPFLGYITRDVPQIENIPLIYILFLVNSAASYLFSYRRSLITASERDWRNTLNLSIFAILQNVAQLIILVYTRNYILYLVAQLVCTLVSNLEISRAAAKMFPFIGQIKGLPGRDETAVIKKNVKAMFANRFGGAAVTGTDNLLIASIDVILVGLYSNYLLILQTVEVILTQVTNAVTASVGNLIASDNSERSSSIYTDLIFISAWVYGFSAIALDCLMTRFITIVFGSGLEIPEFAVHIMALNFYLNGIRQPNLMYINAAGLFRPIRFKGFIEAAVNLGVSAFFMYLGMGLYGILLGTTVSHIATNLWWEPYCVDKYCLGNGASRSFAKMNLFYAVVFGAAWIITRYATTAFSAGFTGFLFATLIVLAIPNLMFFIIYHKTEQFGFIIGVLKNITAKFLRKKV